jgi:hypothetical protein
MKQIYLEHGPLLNSDGNLNQAGYAFELAKEYSRKAIKASSWRIKEWDYYYIGDEKFGVALTIADNSYMDLLSVSVLDFVNKKHWTKSYMEWLTFGLISFPSTSKTGDVFHEGKKFSMYFKNENGKWTSVTRSTKLTVKGNKKRAQAMCRAFRKNPYEFYEKISALLEETTEEE